MKRLSTGALIAGLLVTLASATPAHASAPSIVTMPGFTLSGTSITYSPSNWSNNTDRRDYFVACTVAKPEYNPETSVVPVTDYCVPLYFYQTVSGGADPNSLVIATDLTSAYVPIPGTPSSRRLYDPAIDGEFFAALSINGPGGAQVAVATATTGYTLTSPSGVTVETPQQSSKTPTFNQFASGPVLVSAGADTVLTGSRLSCTTSVSVNDKPTTFNYQTLPTGEGQLSIAMPSDLAPGKHRLSMDSCGGNVVFDNILMVSKPEAKLELTMTTAIERGLALVKLRAFVRENRADYNTVECVADAANPTQKMHATQLVDRFCKRAFSLLASPKERSTLLKSDNQQNSIKLTVTLSNR